MLSANLRPCSNNNNNNNNKGSEELFRTSRSLQERNTKHFQPAFIPSKWCNLFRSHLAFLGSCHRYQAADKEVSAQQHASSKDSTSPAQGYTSLGYTSSTLRATWLVNISHLWIKQSTKPQHVETEFFYRRPCLLSTERAAQALFHRPKHP